MAALAANIVNFNGIWTWFNEPRAAYDASTNRLFWGSIDAAGFVSVTSWDFTRELYLRGVPRTTTLQTDDHNNPAVLVLDNGKILTAYSQHDGDSYSARSTNAGDIRTWDSEVAVASGANNDSYANLFQFGDNSNTVLWVYRRVSSPYVLRYRTSTDRGSTWGGDTDFISISGQRAYFKGVKNGANRVDFVLSTGQPDETATSLYHGYMEMDSGGTLTFYKSDGTQVTSAPFDANEFTLVYDGTTNDGWQWDLAVIGGTPVILYATFESANTVHRYHQARWNGSAWQSDEVTTGGTTATADYLYAAQPSYSGGICQDPNDINAVYLSREYGAGDFRLEKWTHTGTFPSGTWAKDSDVSGNTGTVNARPYCPRGLSPTRVLWWEGTYTSFTSYSTRIRMSPAPSWRGAKEASPVWTASYAPTGVQAYFLIHEGSGTTVNDLANNRDGSITGSPTWNAGAGDDFGPFLSGLTTSAYVNLDTLAAAINTTGYPVWIYFLYKTTETGTTQQFPVAFGNSADNDSVVAIQLHNAAATNVAGFWRDNAATLSQPAANKTGMNDGEFHVIQVVKLGAADFRARFDGLGHATNSTSTSTITLDRGAIGVLRRAAVSNAFTGEVHAVVMGWGSEPDLQWMTMDLIRGQFAGTFDPDAGGIAPKRMHLTRMMGA